MSVQTTSRTLPWSWYSDPSVLALEQVRIFGCFWQYAGYAAQVEATGSFATTTVGQLPVVLVRDRERVLRAFLNVCRHRGSLSATGAGRRETLQCPYHAWTYALDGSLHRRAALRPRAGFDQDGLGLVSMQVDTWGPFVFVNPDLDAPPLVDYLGDLPALLAADGVDLDALAFHKRAETEYEANWKICIENYLECYHCSVAHPSFSKAIDVAPETYSLETRRSLLSQFGRASKRRRRGLRRKGEIARGQFHFLFPNTAINVMPGRPNLSIGPIIPLTAGPDLPLPRLLLRPGHRRGLDCRLRRARQPGRRGGSDARRARPRGNACRGRSTTACSCPSRSV